MRDGFELLATLDDPALVPALERELRRRGVPFESGLLGGAEPRIVVSVPASRLDEARRVVHVLRGLDEEDLVEDEADDDEAGPAAFPWRATATVFGVVLLHVLVLAGWTGTQPDAGRLVEAGGLVGRRLAAEPWRLLSYALLHSGIAHVLWNGLSMIVFAVPVIVRAGYARAGLVYVLGGACGGLAAAAANPADSVTVGSSAAVSGLFGAWTVIALGRARRARLPWRARIRALGIALLFLPSLVSPTTSSGLPVNVPAHLGGVVGGMLAGLVVGGAGVRAAAHGVDPDRRGVTGVFRIR